MIAVLPSGLQLDITGDPTVALACLLAASYAAMSRAGALPVPQGVTEKNRRGSVAAKTATSVPPSGAGVAPASFPPCDPAPATTAGAGGGRAG